MADDLDLRWQAVEAEYPVETWVGLDDQQQLDLLFGPGVRRANVLDDLGWVDRAIAEYLAANGVLSVRTVATKYGRSVNTLTEHMRKRGVKTFRRPPQPRIPALSQLKRGRPKGVKANPASHTYVERRAANEALCRRVERLLAAEMPWPEIAVRVGMTPGAVRLRYYRWAKEREGIQQ